MTSSANKRVVVASDHAGLPLKHELVLAMQAWQIDIEDLGPGPIENDLVTGLSYDLRQGRLVPDTSVDYPDYAERVARRVVACQTCLGLLVCGSGIGMSIAANKICGARAALCHDPYSAKMAREHNDANVLCMGGRVVGAELAKSVLRAFLLNDYEGGRHQRRLDKIADLERQRDKAAAS